MTISAPGKLFIAGEWAILEPENFGIVAAIDKRMFVKIEKSPDESIHITLKDFNIKNKRAILSGVNLRFSKALSEKEKKILVFSKTAIETTLRYLKNWWPFKIEVWGDNSRKLGFGFSAASTAAVIAAVLSFHRKKIEKERLFKLSALSHYLAQGKIGSGFDIAASVFGGIFVYRRFDAAWLKNQLNKEKNIKKIIEIEGEMKSHFIEQPWPNFYFKKLKPPKNLQLSVGWTGKSALTPQLIKKLHKWQEKNRAEYKNLMARIGRLVKELIRAWRLENQEKILDLIKKNEDYLRQLGQKSGVNIETKKLKKLAEIADEFGGAGKVSGAGAGDCGIALTFDKKAAQKIEKEWIQNGILPIKTEVDSSGVNMDA